MMDDRWWRADVVGMCESGRAKAGRDPRWMTGFNDNEVESNKKSFIFYFLDVVKVGLGDEDCSGRSWSNFRGESRAKKEKEEGKK